MRVGVVGAGVAGLVTAKVLGQAGHDVVVLERTADVGGVWSASRRYPGLTTQSPRQQYGLSDFPLPSDLPEWPTGEQVQRWLAAYATWAGLDDRLRLETEVVAARHDAGDGWTLSTRHVRTGEVGEVRVDRLVVANGVYSEPLVPTFEGEEAFAAAGGTLLAGTALHDAEVTRGQHVLVVGYGKTAHDIAVPVSEVAASTAVVARRLHWKVPRRVAGRLNYKWAFLTRLGEALFRYLRLGRVDGLLHGPLDPLRRRLLRWFGAISVWQYGLARLDLAPPGGMQDIVKGSIGLVTEGFFEAVGEGRIRVHAGRRIRRLVERDGAPHAELDDGAVLPADVVVCATGFVQGVPFLDDEVRDRLLDEDGNVALYRQVLPVGGIEGLYLNGYNSSFYSPLNAELAAAWIAADLAGAVAKPSPGEMRAAVAEQIAFMDAATDGHHARGGSVIPFSMKNVDEVLDDLDLQIPARARAKQWFTPIDPSAYADVVPRLLERLGASDNRATPSVGADRRDGSRVR